MHWSQETHLPTTNNVIQDEFIDADMYHFSVSAAPKPLLSEVFHTLIETSWKYLKRQHRSAAKKVA